MLLTIVTVLPFLTGVAGIFYLLAALVLDAIFLHKAWQPPPKDGTC